MEKRLRVLLLTNTVAPYRRPLFEALGRVLDLSVYACQPRPSDRQWSTGWQPEHVRFYPLAARSWRFLGKGPAWVWNPDLAAHLRRNAYDVYIAGENIVNALSVLQVQRAARSRGRPFILWSGAIDTPYAAGHWLTNLYRRWLYRRTDAFVAYGERARKFLVRRGAPDDRITTGTQVIAPGWIWPVPPDKGRLGLQGQVVVLYVGYLIPRKGVADLIQAYQRVRRPESTLVLVGDGPERSRLEAMAAGAPDIRFTGYLEGEEKWRYYASADLFVLPTYHDPWSQVINEAMYFGLPIITTDRDGSTSELIRENGVVVPAGAVEDLADALARLLADPALRAQMGEAAQAVIADYTLERACAAFFDAIQRTGQDVPGRLHLAEGGQS